MVPQRVMMFTTGISTAYQLAAAEEAFSRPAGPGRAWHALTAVGFELHLSTAAEISATQARLREEAERQAEADRRRQADAWRSPTARTGRRGCSPPRSTPRPASHEPAGTAERQRHHVGQLVIAPDCGAKAGERGLSLRLDPACARPFPPSTPIPRGPQHRCPGLAAGPGQRPTTTPTPKPARPQPHGTSRLIPAPAAVTHSGRWAPGSTTTTTGRATATSASRTAPRVPTAASGATNPRARRKAEHGRKPPASTCKAQVRRGVGGNPRGSRSRDPPVRRFFSRPFHPRSTSVEARDAPGALAKNLRERKEGLAGLGPVLSRFSPLPGRPLRSRPSP